jgi:hypothetical protein
LGIRQPERLVAGVFQLSGCFETGLKSSLKTGQTARLRYFRLRGKGVAGWRMRKDFGVFRLLESGLQAA